MRRKFWLRRNRRQQRQQLDWEGREEWEKEKRNAQSALQRMYGFTEAEAQEYTEFVDSEPDDELHRALRKVFLKVSANYDRQLQTLDDCVEQMEGYLQRAREHPLVHRVREKPVKEDLLLSTLGELGVKVEEYEDEWSIPGQYLLYDATIQFCYNLDRMMGLGSFDHLKRLTGHLGGVFRSCGAAVTSIYLDDLIGDTLESKLLLRDLTIPDLKHVEALRDDKGLGIVILMMDMEYVPDGLMAILDRMEKFQSFYPDLKGKYEFEIFRLLPPEREAKPEHTRWIVDGLRKLKSQGANLDTAAKLLRHTPTEQRGEFFEYLAEKPRVVTLYERLRRVGISEQQYLDFLAGASEAMLPTANGPKQFSELLWELSADGAPRKVAAALLRNSDSVSQDAELPLLLNAVAGYPLADLLIGDYAAAKQTLQPHKAALALKLASYRPDANALSALRKAIRTAPDAVAGEWFGAPTLHELQRRALQYRGPTQPREPQREVPLPARPWETLVSEWVKEQENAAERLGVFGMAYAALPGELKPRLRNIWRTQPETLDAFCKAVVVVGSSGGYKSFSLILQSTPLFSAYKEQLRKRGDALTADLAALMDQENGNPYPALYRLLFPTEGVPPPIIENVPEAEKLVTRAPAYDRIIIWGGQYAQEKKRKIEAAAAAKGKAIAIYDVFNKREDMTGLTPRDVVICVTTSINHSLYYVLRDHCKKNKVPFYHFDHAGYQPLIGFLERLSA